MPRLRARHVNPVLDHAKSRKVLDFGFDKNSWIFTWVIKSSPSCSPRRCRNNTPHTLWMTLWSCSKSPPAMTGGALTARLAGTHIFRFLFFVHSWRGCALSVPSIIWGLLCSSGCRLGQLTYILGQLSAVAGRALATTGKPETFALAELIAIFILYEFSPGRPREDAVNILFVVLPLSLVPITIGIETLYQGLC